MAETSCSPENDVLNAKQLNSLCYDDDILRINARVTECGKWDVYQCKLLHSLIYLD